jgi:hypothetical protein
MNESILKTHLDSLAPGAWNIPRRTRVIEFSHQPRRETIPHISSSPKKIDVSRTISVFNRTPDGGDYRKLSEMDELIDEEISSWHLLRPCPAAAKEMRKGSGI